MEFQIMKSMEVWVKVRDKFYFWEFSRYPNTFSTANNAADNLESSCICYFSDMCNSRGRLVKMISNPGNLQCVRQMHKIGKYEFAGVNDQYLIESIVIYGTKDKYFITCGDGNVKFYTNKTQKRIDLF